MSRKVDRAIHGPSWAEVIIGAVLSVLLGVVIAAMLLVLKPVVRAREAPKEPLPNTVYYLEGNLGGSRDQALAKRKAFVDGQSVQLTEEDINLLVTALAASQPAGKPGAAAAGAETVAAGTPNVRIRDGVMQVGVPVTLNLAGFTEKLVIQARGGFQKEGSGFVFEPDEIYLGPCPVQRLPFFTSYLRGKALGTYPIPPDIATAWGKLSHVSIEGKTLALSQ